MYKSPVPEQSHTRRRGSYAPQAALHHRAGLVSRLQGHQLSMCSPRLRRALLQRLAHCTETPCLLQRVLKFWHAEEQEAAEFGPRRRHQQPCIAQQSAASRPARRESRWPCAAVVRLALAPREKKSDDGRSFQSSEAFLTISHGHLPSERPPAAAWMPSVDEKRRRRRQI